MSNDSNRDADRSISPGELQASDFFPPGEGWNKDTEESPSSAQKRDSRECSNDGIANDGARPH